MSADGLLAYRAEIRRCAEGVADSFPSDRALQAYMLGVKAGADAVLACAEVSRPWAFTELMAYQGYVRDMEAMACN